MLIEQHEAAHQQLAEAQRQLAQAQAELESLTLATGALDEDRGNLKNKVAELQAAVDRLTNMLWGRRSEKRPDKNQQTLFDLQPTPDELAEQRKAILDAEKLSDQAKRKLLDELLKRQLKRRLKQLEIRGREEFPRTWSVASSSWTLTRTPSKVWNC